MTSPPDATALIVAAGQGTRVGGDVPKQWRELAGQSVLAHSVAAFDGLADVILVINVNDRDRAAQAFPHIQCVEGGSSRAESVAAGLAAVKTPFVLIHDGARPLVSRAVITRVLDAIRDGADGAAPALAVTDALWSGQDRVDHTVPRDGLWRAQTPQGFRTKVIVSAHATGMSQALDDVEMALESGVEVKIVDGEERNLKITYEEDFERAARLLGPDIRVGNGFDVHRFGPGSSVVLCGVEVPHDRGLAGHSDADVGLHVLCDAIYGALAEGDIGRHFPPSEAEWRGADSAIFLEHAAQLARDKGYRISALDVTLICELPKIGPHAVRMRERVAQIAGLPVDRVSVKATTTERLGFAGRQEGIAAQATATLVR